MFKVRFRLKKDRKPKTEESYVITKKRNEKGRKEKRTEQNKTRRKGGCSFAYSMYALKAYSQ